MEAYQPLVLVVEDQESVRVMLGRLLGRSGLRVELAASGEEALLRLRPGHAFDGVVVDLVMPGVHGIPFLRLVRELAPELPLIVHTGSDISAEELAAAGCEVSNYLRKPVETLRLPEALRQALRG